MMIALLAVASSVFASGAVLPVTEAFPSTAKMYGEAPDPLDALAVGDEDLKDAVASPQTAASLQSGLRSPMTATRLAAVRAAGRPRDVASIPHLSGVMLRLDEPAQVRAAAALALGRIGDTLAVDALGEALSDPAPEVRYSAALALGRLPADGVATRLEKVLRFDPVWQPRYAAAIALGRTRKPFVAGVLADALTQDSSWQVRQQAASSLQDIGGDRAAEALVGALGDREPTVRAAAGSALAQIGGPAQRRALSAALRDETESSVRAVLSVAVRRALARP